MKYEIYTLNKVTTDHHHHHTLIEWMWCRYTKPKKPYNAKQMMRWKTYTHQMFDWMSAGWKINWWTWMRTVYNSIENRLRLKNKKRHWFWTCFVNHDFASLATTAFIHINEKSMPFGHFSTTHKVIRKKGRRMTHGKLVHVWFSIKNESIRKMRFKDS